MITRLLDWCIRLLKRWFPTEAELEARGGGPALDRALDDELHIEAAERGLAGRDRDDWIERRADQRVTRAQADNARPFRISDVLYPKGSQ